MKTSIMTGAALALMTLPAFAQDMEADMALDTDGDGFLSLAEVQAEYPDVSEDDFGQADADEDGLLSAEEVETAKADGLIPMDDA